MDSKETIYERNLLMQQTFFFFSQKTALSTNGVSQSEWLVPALSVQAYVTYVSIASKLKCLNWLNFSFSFSARSLSSALGKSILRDCGL